MALGTAVAGHLRFRLAAWERAALMTASVVLIHFGLVTDLVGLALVGAVLGRQYFARA
jgi:TRAP-type uncharacterized transport system fused permease subunit